MDDDELKYAHTRLSTMVEHEWPTPYATTLLRADVALILAELTQAQAERDGARKVVDAVTARYWECPGAVVEAWQAYRATLAPNTTSLIRAIVEAAKADPRPFVEVYADVAQSKRWVGLWGSLSVGERARVVEDAKKEAGR